MNVSSNSVHGVTMPANVTTASAADAASIQNCQTIRTRRRSNISAVAPETNPSNRIGTLAAVCINAINSGDDVSVAISHVPAVSCIQPPTLVTIEEIHRLRKSGRRSGAHADGASRLSAEFRPFTTPMLQ